MATYGHYKELTAEWGINYGLTGNSATRVFHDDTTEVAPLPSIGESFSRNNKIEMGLCVESIQKRKFGGHPSKHIYTVTYSSRLSGGNTTSTDLEKNMARNYQLGAEIISINGENTTYKWKGTTDAVNQRIGRPVGAGGFTIERRTNRDTFPSERLRSTYIGKINSAEFEGHPVGTVLFEGANANRYVNDEGNVRWKVTLSFKYKECSWLFLFRETTMTFTEVNPAMYQSADLNELLKPSFF